MHDLLPSLPGSINNVLQSMAYFMPEFCLAVLFILVLLADIVIGRNSGKICRAIACAGVLLIIFTDHQQIQLLLSAAMPSGLPLFSRMLLLTHTGINFKLTVDGLALILLLYFAWDGQLNTHPKGLSDLYTIFIGAMLGLHLMIMAINLLSIYLAIEMVSIASYLMVAYRSENAFGTEAGLKYVLFGAAASAMMLYGISLLYAFTGTFDLLGGALVTGLLQVHPLAVSLAIVMVFAGIGFKLSFVPVHFWVPDVYMGAPTPVTAWLSTLPKIAAFALLVNFLNPFISRSGWHAVDFKLILSVIGIVTMIAGNFAAVLQHNIKRMLAYSSIGHTGFALMAVVTFDPGATSALIYYLIVYGLANIGALALATYFTNATGATDVDNYRGLGHKYPVASICFVVVLISLTGLPISAGFTAKLFVFSAVYGSYQQNHQVALLLLTVTGALTTVVSLFYYIKIPLNLFIKRSEIVMIPVFRSKSILVLAVILSFLLILWGLYPDMLLKCL